MFEIAIGILLGVVGFLILRYTFRDILEIDKIKKYENSYKIPSRFRNSSENSHS